MQIEVQKLLNVIVIVYDKDENGIETENMYII